jgi:LPXTG-site transpeptidase (sortase) family protein
MGSVGIGIGLQSSAEPPAPGPQQRGTLPVTATAPGPALARSTPVRLDVTSVGIHTRLIELGLNPDDTLEVPSKPLLAGWYTGSPTPGQQGPSIIAGHVDSTDGPAVFYRLGEVKPDDRIKVTLKDGEVATFKVAAVRSYSQKNFPTQTVYGNTDRATLRLITCGDWNDETKQYDGNVVVFAELDLPGL